MRCVSRKRVAEKKKGAEREKKGSKSALGSARPLVVTIVLFFVAGGLFADLLKSRANPHLLSERGFAQHVATKLSGPGKKPSRKVVLRVQALLPTLTAVIGLVSALIGLYGKMG